MGQAINTTHTICPLCGEPISLAFPDWRISPKWRDVLERRDLWARVAETARARGSIEEAARRHHITEDQARRLLEFLCKEVCGCRAVICVSCLDDYRSEL